MAGVLVGTVCENVKRLSLFGLTWLWNRAWLLGRISCVNSGRVGTVWLLVLCSRVLMCSALLGWQRLCFDYGKTLVVWRGWLVIVNLERLSVGRPKGSSDRLWLRCVMSMRCGLVCLVKCVRLWLLALVAVTLLLCLPCRSRAMCVPGLLDLSEVARTRTLLWHTWIRSLTLEMKNTVALKPELNPFGRCRTVKHRFGLVSLWTLWIGRHEIACLPGRLVSVKWPEQIDLV